MNIHKKQSNTINIMKQRVHIMDDKGNIITSYNREVIQTEPRFYVTGSGKLFHGYTFHNKPTTGLYIHTGGQFLAQSKEQ